MFDYPEDEPIRPLSFYRPRVEDLNFDPKHSEYAFNESLRNDEKKSRIGCTDPFCQRCKDLPKYVEASIWDIPKAPAIFDSNSKAWPSVLVPPNVLQGSSATGASSASTVHAWRI